MALPYTCIQFLYGCFLYLHALEGYQTVSLRMSACQIRAPLKRQHGYILFEELVFHPYIVQL